MIFLTVNDAPSGILRSQVIDVVLLLKKEAASDIRLVAFISVRKYWKNRKWIKRNCPKAIVVPMWPKLKNWRKNRFQLSILSRFINTDFIIARGVFATNIALDLKKKGRTKVVCYDGRGAFKAEVTEYDVIPDPNVKAAIPLLEKRAVLESDYRIAVTQKLVDFWHKEFVYESDHHIVIPCTVSADFVFPSAGILSGARGNVRRELGWGEDDLVLVYSGSVAGWQSFEGLAIQLKEWLEAKPEHRVLFLSGEHEALAKLERIAPGQVQRKWLAHDEVQGHLFAADYGLMIREASVTNSVASPTKFAEYLMAGLGVLCSRNLGDYTDFIKKYECGFIVHDQTELHGLNLHISNFEAKEKLIQLGFEHFSKSSDLIKDKYLMLHTALTHL